MCQHILPPPPPAPRSCDNITIAPPLLKELEASKEPLPYQLWPGMVRPAACCCCSPHPPASNHTLPDVSVPFTSPAAQGGCEDEHVRMDYMAEQRFREMHGEDQ